MKQELVKLANHLDSIGHRDLADRLDKILKLAQDADLLNEGDLDYQAKRHEELGEKKVLTDEEANELRTLKVMLSAPGASRLPFEAPAPSQSALESGDEPDPEALQESGEQALLPPTEEEIEGLFDIGEKQDGDLPTFDDLEDKPATADAFDAFAAQSSQERIDKLADLMAGEFTTYTPGTFSR